MFIALRFVNPYNNKAFRALVVLVAIECGKRELQ